MNAKLTAVSTAAFALALASQARAQNAPPTTAEQPEGALLAAPTQALEVIVGTGYTQGFGDLQKDVSLENVITPGMSADVGVGYRIDPHWSVSANGQYQEFNSVRANAARGLTAGLAVAYHILPYGRIDPWFQLGAGYRALWETNPTGPDLLTQGLELGKLQFGVDLRASRDLAIAPVIGADATLPLWQGTAGSSAHNISDPRPAVYVFAGIQARFDVTSTHTTGQPPPAAPETTVTQAEVPAPPPAKPVSPSISVSEDVLETCKLMLGNIDTAPKFDFDKSELQPGDVDALQKIADCFATGPLKGEGVRLVGRADPRGSVAYNDALGMRRANAVATFLQDHGVEAKRIEKISRGKRDATGTDEAGWARDRRVDVTTRIEIERAR